jgi:hypothetical protein
MKSDIGLLGYSNEQNFSFCDFLICLRRKKTKKDPGKEKDRKLHKEIGDA